MKPRLDIGIPVLLAMIYGVYILYILLSIILVHHFLPYGLFFYYLCSRISVGKRGWPPKILLAIICVTGTMD